MSPQPSSCTSYPIAHHINCASNFVHYRKFLATIVSTTNLKSFKEAMRDRGGKASMQDEICAIEETSFRQSMGLSQRIFVQW